MKKILYSIFVFVMIFALVGCNNTGEAKLAKRLNVNTNNLLQAINNLETVTNEDVAISDFLNENNSINNISYEINYNQPIKKVSKFKQIFSGAFINEIKNVNTYNERKIMPATSTYQPKNYSNEDILNYKAKYTTNENIDSLNNSFIELYKNRMESLYNACGDCLYTNSQCNNCQTELKTSIQECKTLCEKLNKGEITLNESQLKECNSYCDEINNLCTKIKGCKGNCNSYLNTLKSLKSYFGSNTESLTTNYLNLLDCLECRLGYYNQALNCVNKCNNLLKSCYTPKNNETNNETIINTNNNNQNNINNNEDNNTNVNNNTNNKNTQINQPTVQPIINGNRPINNFNGYNSNNGIYNNGFGYGYGYNGYGINPYNPTPNNVNTYGPINRNVDTYNNVVRNTDTFNTNNEKTTENTNANNNTNEKTEENSENKEIYQTRKIINRPKFIREKDTKFLDNKNIEIKENNTIQPNLLKHKEENIIKDEVKNEIEENNNPKRLENNLKLEENIKQDTKITTTLNNEVSEQSNKEKNEQDVPYVEHSTNTNPLTKDIKTDENLKHKHNSVIQDLKNEKEDNKNNTESNKDKQNIVLLEENKSEQKNEDKLTDGEKNGTMPISLEDTKPTFLSSNI